MQKILFIVFLSLASLQAFSQDFPALPLPARLVNDYAGLLQGQEQSYLENKLKNYFDTTSTQIAVVIMSEVPNGYDYSDYAERLAETWKIGEKGKNNGVLLYVALKEKKIWIATGYGMEGALPDATVKVIIDKIIVPDFKTGQYLKGLDKGTDAIMQAAAGEFHPDKVTNSEGGAVGIVFVILLIFIIYGIIVAKRGNRYNTYNGRGMNSGPFFGGFGGGHWGRGGVGDGGFRGFGGGGFGGGGAGGSW